MGAPAKSNESVEADDFYEVIGDSPAGKRSIESSIIRTAKGAVTLRAHLYSEGRQQNPDSGDVLAIQASEFDHVILRFKANAECFLEIIDLFNIRLLLGCALCLRLFLCVRTGCTASST